MIFIMSWMNDSFLVLIYMLLLFLNNKCPFLGLTSMISLIKDVHGVLTYNLEQIIPLSYHK